MGTVSVFSTFLLIVLIVGCSEPPVIVPPYIEEDEYAVYDVIFRAIVEGARKRRVVESIVVISDSGATAILGDLDGGDKGIRYLRGRLSRSIEKSTWSDFKAKNRQAYRIEDKFDLDVDVLIAGHDDAGEILSEKMVSGSKSIRSECLGLFWISRVGFNYSRDEAIVFLEHCGGPGVRRSMLYFLKKENGEWMIDRISVLGEE